MNTEQVDYILRRCLRGLKVDFLGVFASDRIPMHPTSYPCCFVANTDPAALGGSHWVAFYYTSSDTLDFFDSLGQDPNTYGFPTSHTLNYNSYQFQSFTSNVCGHYCIYFLYHRSRSKSLAFIINQLANCGKSVDHYVRHFVNELVDSNYLTLKKRCTSQSCKCHGQ